MIMEYKKYQDSVSEADALLSKDLVDTKYTLNNLLRSPDGLDGTVLEERARNINTSTYAVFTDEIDQAVRALNRLKESVGRKIDQEIQE